MKDTPMDTGLEPNPDTGPMWVTEDIWVRTSPDPGYQPYAFPESSPLWVPLPHENAEYRDPKYSVPNYVYVRIRNRGSAASNGTERLRLYWAKASTGLSWPTQWVDYLASNCGPTKLYGAEVTKARKNAATATPAERDAYRNAVLAVGTNPAYVFFGGVSYWHKQQEVHSLGPANRHGTAAFLPWHREFVNRYEVLLQEFDPTVKLLYWDWTTNPESSTGGFNLDTSTFMGNSGAGTGGVSISAPFNPPTGPTLVPPSVTRDLGGNACCRTPTITSDANVLGNTTFPSFHTFLESSPHNYSHVYIGGGGGDMSFISSAARDPFFFLLHGNVDRLWAQWQRDPSSLSRLDRATTYGTETTNVNITTVMAPWNGTGTSIEPWTTAGGYIVSKPPTDPSVVSPPVYDSVPLTIPILQPGQAVVIQIPWYPANPADFSCFGGDQGHFCLLARIETSTAPPFGMTFPEIADVYANTRNNNNIVWKNITVVDNFPGPLRRTSILIRNIFGEPVQAGLRFADTEKFGGSFFGNGHMFVDMKPELFKRWREGGAAGRGIKVAEDRQTGRLEIITPDAFIRNITLEPKETFSLDLQFELSKDYTLREGPFPEFDLIQIGAPGKPDAIVGGQRFVLDFSKLVLVKSGDQWRYRDDGSYPGQAWISSDYDDSKWKLGRAELGFGDSPATTIDGGPPDHRHIATYFRHTFDVADPSFYRSLVLRLKRADGAVVYLNGKEIHRVNLSTGEVNARRLAMRAVGGLEKESFFPVRLSPGNLNHGKNVIAVEIHQHSPRSNHLSFDLELSANRADPGFPPDVAFAEPPDGALFQPGETVSVTIEALDGDGKVKSVSLYVDGKLVGTKDDPPYTFRWPAGSKGSHRLRAEAVDNDQKRSTSFLTVTVVENVPPAVMLIHPSDSTAVKAEEAISVSAQASDRNGKVKRVEFWVREADFFMSQNRLVATVSTPPYRASIKDLKPGHYMLWAVAVNDRDATSQSMPVHVAIK
jgi:hypothetical protein